MIQQPFLTDLDSRAEVKGSVDPLGAMAIWTRLGRRVVGNLTTVTTSVKDFKTLVLGFALLEDLRRKGGSEQEPNDLAAFLRWEQLAAYTRGSLNNDFGFRGVRRVKAHLAEGSVVPISAERDSQILGNQKIYGLWGLFTVSSRASGLLERDVNALTGPAEEFVNGSWRRTLSPIWPMLLKTIGRDDRRFNLNRQEHNLRRLLRAVWKDASAADRNFWRHHLVHGGAFDKTDGRQKILAELLTETPRSGSFEFSQASIRDLARNARSRDERLATDLLDIAACESVLAYGAALFNYLQTLDGQPMGKPIDAMRRAWPKTLKHVDRERFANLCPDLAKASGNEAVANHWVLLSDDLSEGRWSDGVSRLLTINQLVMNGRGGAAWVAEENGTLRVRYRDEAAALPEAKELAGLWRYPYFIGSLGSVARELEEV